jgi:hypothetical protein
MDNRQEHLNNLSEIRALMERSSSFLSLSGLSGISAGVIGLITTAILYYKLSRYLDIDNYGSGVLTVNGRGDLIVFCTILFVIVLIVTFASTAFFTIRKSKKKGLNVWDAPAKKLVQNLFIPLIIGGVFCLLLVYHYYDFAVLPSMLIFYGLSLINASKYTLNELKWLGITVAVLGLLAFYFMSQALVFWGLGFGVMNIIYGAVMYFKYER